jgi:pimeloyl-ACP methyl ester carboxylesterase
MRNLAGLAADDYGESDARPPLVLLHGLTFDRSLWRPALASCAQAATLDKTSSPGIGGRSSNGPSRSSSTAPREGWRRRGPRALPYLVVAGRDLDPDYERWLNEMLPQATVTVWPGSGHFPHVAHPDRFAECLAATAW